MAAHDNTKYHDADSFRRLKALRGTKRFSLLHLNTRSLKNKHDSVNLFLDNLDHEFDVLAFTETWFSNDCPAVNFSGYNCISVSRPKKRGGGVAVYIKNHFNYEVIPEYSIIDVHYECLLVKCFNTMLAVLYRPPNGSVTKFIEFLERVLEHCSYVGLPIIISGDLNINFLSVESPAQMLLDVFLCFGCQNVIDVPTRIASKSETLLDVCFTNYEIGQSDAGVLISDISDHLPFFIFFTPHMAQHNQRKQPPIFLRKISAERVNYFKHLVEGTSWEPVLQITDPTVSYDLFIRTLKELYYTVFPLEQLKKHKKSRKPWIDASLLKRIKTRDKLFALFIKTKNLDQLAEYKKMRNKLAADIKQARNLYYEAKFTSIANDSRKVWNCVNELRNKNERDVISEILIEGVSYTGSSLANKFNEHFLKAGVCTSSPTNDISCTSYMNSSDSTIYMYPTTPEEICGLLKKLKSNSACGVDELKAVPLKVVAHAICLPLSHICNLILSSGTFPNELKIAKVSVIFKGGDKNDLGNYRPISVLPMFSKVIEEAINFRLTNFFQQKNIIVKNQYGFQKKKSTEMALLDIKDKIVDNIEKKLFTVGLFLDFKKAFDSVKHDVLLLKLSRYGVRGIALDIVKSYLENRVQYTNIGNAKSEFGKITCGVPQGSILGPLLFIMYINDIVNIPLTPDIILYADDTNVFFSGPDIDDLMLKANIWLQNLSTWLRANRLNLNAKKTKFVVFRPRNKTYTSKNIISFQGQPIERVASLKFLGVFFHEYLDWSVHINYLRKNISRAVGILCTLRSLLPVWLKRQIYYATIHSHLHYCLLIWGTTTKTNLKNLYLLQKRAVRLIELLPFRSHTAPFFEKHRLLVINNIRYKKLAMIIYREVKSNRIEFFRKYHERDHSHNLRHISFKKDTLRTNYGTQKLTYQIPHFLNEHPTVMALIEQSSSIYVFKKKIHTFLLKTQTDSHTSFDSFYFM